MYSVSDNFKIALRYSHQVITKAEVLRDGNVLATIYPDSGSVEVDARRAQRRTCELSLHAGGRSVVYTDTYNTYANLDAAYADYDELESSVATYADTQVITGQAIDTVDDGLVPTSGLSLISPFGNEVRLFRGLRYRKAQAYTYADLAGGYVDYDALESGVTGYSAIANLTTTAVTLDEYAPLGVFPIVSVDINQDSTGVDLRITGVDRSRRIARNRWREPYQIASGTNVGDALTTLLQDRWTEIPLNFTATSATTTAVTLGVDADNDPWGDAVAIAEAAGMDLFFDADGVCVLQPTPDYTMAASVEAYNENEEAMVLTTGRTLSSEGVYNTVVVTAEGSDTTLPYRGTAVDDNPASPTYVDGPFGYVPTFRSSALINSQESADAYAQSELARLRGVDESIVWSQIVDPSLDAGDVVSIVNVTSKLARAIVLDRLNVPLSVEEPMSAQGRTIVYTVGDTVVTAGGEVVGVFAPEPTSTAPGDRTSSYPGGLIRIQTIV